MQIEFELTEEDLIVLKAADRAFVQDIDEDYMTPESIGWRRTDELYPEQYLAYKWNKLVWIRLLETEGDGYYRITEEGRKILYPPQPEPDELMILRAEVARLREALAPFAALAREMLETSIDKPDDRVWYAYNDQVITLGDLRRAVRALDSVRRTDS